MLQSLKEKVFEILEPEEKDSEYFETFIISLIILNIIAVVLETVDWIYAIYAPIFNAFNLFSVAVFSVEYILRAWCCTVDPRYRDPVLGRLRYALTPIALVDLMAFLPFCLPIVLPDLRFLRVARLFRLFRLLKLARHSEIVGTFSELLKRKKEELGVTLFTWMILMVVASSLMYEVEHEAQPKLFSSIPAAMWWGVITLTTIGYGDMYPVTPLGRAIASIIAFMGILMLALPTAIFASGFMEVLEDKKKRVRCPHCGRYLEEEAGTEAHDAEVKTSEAGGKVVRSLSKGA
jgi:voltage-gated potassium channel